MLTFIMATTARAVTFASETNWLQNLPGVEIRRLPGRAAVHEQPGGPLRNALAVKPEPLNSCDLMSTSP